MSRIQPTCRLRGAIKRDANPSEHAESVQLMQLVRLHENKHPELRWLFAVPNGGHRNKVAASKLKAEGVKPGVPDYLLPVMNTDTSADMWCGLAIELKRKRGGRVSDEQRDWIQFFDDQGWRAAVCAGHERAWAVICEYLGIANCLERAA